MNEKLPTYTYKTQNIILKIYLINFPIYICHQIPGECKIKQILTKCEAWLRFLWSLSLRWVMWENIEKNRQGTLQSNAILVKILFTFLFTLSVSWLNETSQPNILTKIFLWAYWNCAYYMLNILNVLNIYRYILLCKQKW